MKIAGPPAPKVATEAAEQKEAVVQGASLESTFAQKAKEAGKLLDNDEKEYVRLQFERNLLVAKYPNTSDRNKQVVSQIQQLKDRVKKIAKRRPKDDPLKLAFKSTPAMSAAEKMHAFRSRRK